jgi:ACS family hexuronate transporter-like MFS transporter
VTPNRRRLLLILLILAGVINYADRQIIAVLKPVLEHDLRWSDQDYGLLTSVFQFAVAVSCLGVGWFVDRVGLKWANPLSVAVWSLSAMGHAVARTLAQFVVVRVALGASEAVYTPAAVKSFAAFYTPQERGLALGVMNASNNIGAIITPLIVPALAVALGWRAAFLIIGGIGLVWAAAWFPLMFGAVSQATKPSEAVRLSPLKAVSWGEVLGDRRTWAIMGAKALCDNPWWFLLFWAPDLFHRVFHLGLSQIGLPLAVIYACAAGGSLLGGFASGRLMRMGLSLNAARKLALLVCALLVTPVVLVLFVKSLWLATALLGLALAAHQGFSTNVFALITDIIPTRRVGSVTSLGALSGNLAGMSILALVGFSLAHGGSFVPFFAFISIAYLLSLGWVQLLLPRLQPAETPEPFAP